MGFDPVSAAVMLAQTVQGFRQSSALAKGVKQQGEAQAAAATAAKRTEQQNAQDIANANRKPPDLATILARAQQLSGTKPATMLTGPGGVMRPTLLGQ